MTILHRIVLGVFDAYVEKRMVLKTLSEISQGTFKEASILPEDVNEILEDGFTFIVVDPAAYSPGLEERWAESLRHSVRVYGDSPHLKLMVRKHASDSDSSSHCH